MHVFYLFYWDTGSTTQSLCLVRYGLKNWKDSSVYSPFALPSTMIEVFIQEKQPAMTFSTTVPVSLSLLLPSKTNPAPWLSPGSSDTQSSSSQPASAAEAEAAKVKNIINMKDSCTCRPNLAVWGVIAWLEPVLVEWEWMPTISQSQSSLYTNTASVSLPPVVADQTQESGYQSSTI